MPSITVHDVPQETLDELAGRATRMGRSLQEYVLHELKELARRPDPVDPMTSVREHKRRSRAAVPAPVILGERDADRR